MTRSPGLSTGCDGLSGSNELRWFTNLVRKLARGRESYATRAWAEACESLSRVGGAETLDAEDIELLAATTMQRQGFTHLADAVSGDLSE